MNSQNIGSYGSFYAVGVGQNTTNTTAADSTNVSQGTLESSNVDLTREMTGQIVAQRGAEANVKSIQTEDSMFQTLLDIKA
ncbi:flagellar basal body rod C-terminal domain-containing protein [Helicobacter sp. UBA3407]|uniref:flagellar basal body rod C-terminal domain-containing protein n=1 Tax=Helicobacter TaxID=209 RepID=UPI002608DC08|nr:flagellar basal body rod C-terminal domain-containing protein [Helicobacter sp. UBA3407]